MLAVNRNCLVWLIVAGVLICCLGCGPQGPTTYPVRGKVVFEDGAPLATGGKVLFESASLQGVGKNARGAIQPDGTFEMTTFESGDGAVPGKHRVLVKAKRDSDDYIKRGIIPRPVIDERFEDYDTSGLEFTVEQGDNEFEAVVSRPRKR